MSVGINISGARRGFSAHLTPCDCPRPKSMFRPSKWNEDVEEAYRFQLAGYRDEKEYAAIHANLNDLMRWEHNGFIKRLKRKMDGYFYYYNKGRECTDKDVHKCKMYVY
ncbi:meiosis expressed gene 1 protein homolog [Lineus longissimus]|uniref:meiosis expressed gene 1 protein homolog n=1 Tax=Lineus longissimus TaxID=88925 RepID=UPI00315D4103